MGEAFADSASAFANAACNAMWFVFDKDAVIEAESVGYDRRRSSRHIVKIAEARRLFSCRGSLLCSFNLIEYRLVSGQYRNPLEKIE